MTHEHSWPTKIGPGAEHVGVSTLSPHWSTICEVLFAHSIPHTILSRTLPKPPTLEGWSFSVYTGAEEHASGWGSATLADMAPALLAAVGMSDATTANKRAQVAETRVIDLAHERDGAVEALDIANDTLGKVCALMAGAGFDGDLLSAVSELINSRNNAIKARDSKQREIVEVWSALGSSSSDSASVLAKRACANLNRWEAFTREQVAEHEMLDRASITTDLNDRHYDLRLALGDVLKARAKDRSAMRGALKGWEDFVRERLPTVTLATDTVARHTDLRAALAEDFTALATENDRHRKATREQSSEDIQRSMSLHAAHDAKCGELSAISRVLGPRRGDESVFDQAERARGILDCWHTLALKYLPDCPQVRNAGHGNAGFDLGTLHFELRGFMSGEISALRDRISLAAEREDLTIAALGHPCSTNGIPEAVRATSAELDITKARLTTSEGDNATLRAILAGYAEREAEIRRDLGLSSNNDVVAGVEHAASEVRRYRHCADSLATENAHLRSSLAAADSVVRLVTAALETPEGVLVTERAATVLKEAKSAAMWESEARKAWAYGDQLDRVLPKGGPNDGLLERTVTLAGEVTRLREQCERLENRRNTDAENEAAWIVWAHQWACQLLASPSAENLRWTIGKRIEDMRTDLRVSREVLENIARVTEYPSGTSLVDHVAKVYKNSERANRMTEEVARLNRAMENTGGYGAREAAKALRKENEYLSERVGNLRACWEAWQKWARGKLDINAVNATVSDDKLRSAIDAYYAEAVFNTAVQSGDCRAAVDYLIAHPGRGLTAELAHEGAKALRQRLENGLPLTQPLRYLIEMALTEGVDAAHRMWDAEVQRTRDESTTLRKRLDQWVAWGCRAACVINADDDSLRMLIDRALPMWRRGTPEV